MSWITEISYRDASARLKKLYDRVKGPDDNIDNIMQVHSLRPHTMEGHMSLYKNVLHHSGNTLPDWYLETVGLLVSLLNSCDYCIDHHFQGLRRLIKDDEKTERIRRTLASDTDNTVFDERERQGLAYARKLTTEPEETKEEDLAALREVGFSDGEILEINQVAGYFNYANRTVLGLGVTTEGDVLGLSPNKSDDPDNWSHR